MLAVEGVDHSYRDLATGVRVHLASAGPPDAPPLLLLHGWPQHWWSWREVIGRLAGDFRILCPDLRGHGWSGAPADGDFAKDRLVDDALALLDALGVERAGLAGHDWGGWTALLAAAREPQRFPRVVALSIGHPWVPTATAARNAWRLLYQLPLAAPLLGEALVGDGRYARLILERGRRDDAGWGPGEVDAYLERLQPATAKLYRSFVLRETPAAVTGRGRSPRPARGAALLLHGTRDPLGRELVQDFPGELELVRGAGHFLPEEAPERVADRVSAWCG